MKVLFVYPNLYTQMGFNHGLAALSASLLEAGHETKLINLNENLGSVPSDDQILENILGWEASAIAFSCLSQQYAQALRLAHSLRSLAKASGDSLPPLIVGGIHPTMVPEDVMGDGVWDFVGVGECEDALVQLVESLERGEVRDDHLNFLCWVGGERSDNPKEQSWKTNPVGEFPNLAELPFPDYALFDTQAILDGKHGWAGLLTSRGCPYRCTYCLNHKIVDRYKADLGRSTAGIGFFRFRRPDDVIEEMRIVVNLYKNVGTFILDDDLFTQNVEHALAICAAYEASELNLPLVVNSHVKRLDPRVAEALGRAGCRILKLGIESGSRRVRYEVLKRPMSDADIFETIEFSEASGLHTSGFVMLGLPTETRAERFETVDMLARSGIGRFRTSLFYPFPGTESHRLSIEGGFVDEDAVRSLTDFTSSSCLDFGEGENLFISKLATCMPWYVNARMDRFHEAPAAGRYQSLVARVEAMSRSEWEAFEPTVREVDRKLSEAATAAGELHYAIRYNAFMGVRSDFFLAEETGSEWSTAAAKPVPDGLQALALSAAADERA
ncbi:MAG: anaerobic magnesium-protoporphyrin IX monomethyl ester cyclase [Planctomycetota bacterium]|jgi:anaerobic magnesium-protoporphyrin IX monomethyl ester cyclase